MKKLSILFVILCFTAWLRAPSINYGLPYLYNEDEGHHFNRVVNMMKSGDMNPHYFHKPSLHFYLRLPITYAAYIWEVTRGRATTMADLDTRDRFGLAQYAFSASHPSLVKANRIFSLSLSLLVIALTFYITFFFTNSLQLASVAALVVGLSPPLVVESAVIGVDPLMCFFTLAATFFALNNKLVISAIAAGLACSSKYNAAPIAVLPFVLCLVNKSYSKKNLLYAILIPPLAFFIGSPYFLTSLKLVREHVGYEVWHYAVAGHVGHSATPGVPQLIFYLKWFANTGVGVTALITALLGGLLLVSKYKDKKTLLLLLFPILYMLLMCAQKTNFTRNMYVMIPYLAVFSAILLKSLENNAIKFLFIFAVLLQPLVQSFQKSTELSSLTESRSELFPWLKNNVKANQEIAVSGELQLAPEITKSFFIKTYSSKDTSLEQLFLDGYSLVVTEQDASQSFNAIARFGSNPVSRIVINPKISVLAPIDTKPAVVPILTLDNCESSKEGHCWIQQKFTLLPIKTVRAISFEAMSPWQDQQLKVADTPAISLTSEWQQIIVGISENSLQRDGGVLFYVNKIHSPALLKIGSDERRLGVAIKNFKIQ